MVVIQLIFFPQFWNSIYLFICFTIAEFSCNYSNMRREKSKKLSTYPTHRIAIMTEHHSRVSVAARTGARVCLIQTIPLARAHVYGQSKRECGWVLVCDGFLSFVGTLYSSRCRATVHGVVHFRLTRKCMVEPNDSLYLFAIFSGEIPAVVVNCWWGREGDVWCGVVWIRRWLSALARCFYVELTDWDDRWPFLSRRPSILEDADSSFSIP